MILTDLQLDALAEVFNIGAGKAAASISEIVNDEVQLSVPSIEFKPSCLINADALTLNANKFGTVRQEFHGIFDATVLLMFSENSALEIVREMMNSNLSLDELAEFEQDAMCEIGNIIINACLATMADMLSMRLDCSLPSYSIISSNEIVTEITHNTVQEYTLLLNVIFTSVKRQTEGRLVLLLTSASIANLIQRIDQFLAGI